MRAPCHNSWLNGWLLCSRHTFAHHRRCQKLISFCFGTFTFVVPVVRDSNGFSEWMNAHHRLPSATLQRWQCSASMSEWFNTSAPLWMWRALCAKILNKMFNTKHKKRKQFTRSPSTSLSLPLSLSLFSFSVNASSAVFWQLAHTESRRGQKALYG